MSSRQDSLSCRISDAIADEAGDWDARLRAPDCTDEDRGQFAAWRDADPEHRIAFEKIQAIVATFKNNMSRADIRALRDAAVRAQHQRRVHKRVIGVAVTIAAIAVSAVIWTMFAGPTQLAGLRQVAALVNTLLGEKRAGLYETDVGQRMTVTLQDGSAVELNAKTRIKVAFSETTRNVELLHGQALFHVAKNPQRPFIVRAADRDITAVGTAFDIRLDATTVRVTLVEGEVRVTKESYLEPTVGRRAAMPAAKDTISAAKTSSGKTQASTRSRGPAPDATSSGKNEIYLTAGQQFVARLASTQTSPPPDTASVTSKASATQDAAVRSIDLSKALGWRDGRVFLEDLTLAEAVAEMNKYSTLQIRIASPQLAQLRVNGMFRAGDQARFVAALEHYFPITAQRQTSTQIALISRR